MSTGEIAREPNADAEWPAQKSTYSFPRRNDRTFERIVSILAAGNSNRLKLLSFGCSKGIEPLDLKRLAPSAEVYGCDVDADALEIARGECAEAGIHIFESSRDAILRLGPFDAIVAMNVLVDWPAIHTRDRIDHIYPFRRFNDSVSTMFDALTVGGYMAIYNTCYLVEQTTVAGKLHPVHHTMPRRNGWLDKYDRFGQRIAVAVDAKGTPIDKDWRKYMNGNSYYPKVLECKFLPKDTPADCKTIIWQKLTD
ncbi:class I SAM-dependent methyltransferase [Mesorhizobium sp. CN2-181]|uniref:class I SAM-dependent methyltransferase n=1 Tax=Mesorhizobium yinganensis TaxID=3157707 RepID=UPI0032B8162C